MRFGAGFYIFEQVPGSESPIPQGLKPSAEDAESNVRAEARTLPLSCPFKTATLLDHNLR
jgi:hypothetical protein